MLKHRSPSTITSVPGELNPPGRYVERRVSTSAHELEVLRTVFDQAPVGLARLSPDGRFLTVNRKYCEIVGHTADELYRRTFLDITHPDDFAIGSVERELLLKREIQSYTTEKRYVRAEGSTLWAELTVSAVGQPIGPVEHLIAVLQEIGERKESQTALRESALRHRAILDAALDGIITIDHEGTILEWNPAAEHIFGYASGDAIGHELATLVVPPSLRPQHRVGLTRHLATGEKRIIGKRTHLPAQRADGSQFPAEVSIARIGTSEPPVFTGYVRDLTDHERALQELRESEKRLRVVVDASPDDTFQLKGPDGRWLIANSATLRLFHLESIEYEGKTDAELASLTAPTYRAAFLACASSDDAAWRQGTVLRTEEVVHFPGQEPRAFHVTKVPMFHDDGRRQGLVSLARDITREKEAEAQRLRILEEAVRARDEFLSIASHELRTPATSLSLAVEALARLSQSAFVQGQDDLFRRFIHTCERQSRQLRSLIDRLLDLGRIQGGGLHLDLEVFDLAALVRDLVSSMDEQLARAGCVTTVLADAPVVGRWDRSRLHEVFSNLLSNASKYGAGHPIDVTVTTDGDCVQVAVRDRGIGIASEQQEKIFGKFERAVPSGSYGGLGLGLYIATEIVQAHGGRIRVKSEVGVGSTFAVELPLDVRSAAASESRSNNMSGQEGKKP